MRQLGLTPDFIACRGTSPLGEGAKTKISMFTSVPENAIISIHDVTNIYRVPLMMMDQNVPSMLAQRLRIHPYCTRKGSQNYSEVTQKDCADIRKSDLITEWTAVIIWHGQEFSCLG